MDIPFYGTLFYDVYLEEEYSTPEKPDYQHIDCHLQHTQEIKNYIITKWKAAKIPSCFYGKLKNKVWACNMYVKELIDGSLCARILIQFLPDFRMTDELLEECWLQMDAQWANGFGKDINHTPIPNTNGWKLCIQHES